MENSNFDKLLERYLTGRVSERERIKIEAWLDTMKTDSLTDLTLSRNEEDLLFEKITRNTDDIQEVIAFRPAGGPKNPGRRWLMGIAASIALLVLMSYLAWYVANPAPAQLQVHSKGGIEKVILGDGTLAWLRGESSLVYYEKPADGIRYAELNGEALFEVVKDSRHPFVIRCGDVTAKVVGTSFTLRSTGERVELEVLTGKVSLSSTIDKIGVMVQSNEKAVYRRDGYLEREALKNADLTAAVSGTEYDMRFTNTGMDMVLDRIEKKFSVHISVADKQLTKCRITADFTDRNLDTTLKMLSELLEFNYQINGTNVTVSGKGCN